VFGDDAATRVANQVPGHDSGATSVLGEQQGYGATARFPGAQQVPPTAQYGQGATAYGQEAAPYGREGATRGREDTSGHRQPDRPSEEDAYADLYGGRREPAADTRRQQQEQLRQQEEQRQRRMEEQQEQRRRAEEQRIEQRRRQEAERAHRERVRAEQEAARRAQTQARRADQPGLWGFVKLLPLMIIPLIQIPLGYGAALAWAWFTTETQVWTGAPYSFEPLRWDSFWHATMLGYFILNNLVSLEYLVRSLRTSFVTGAVLALGAIAATNGLLYSFGFWG
jgi:hypothetical protein